MKHMHIHIRELKYNVTNPRPDRRSKDWNKLPEIKAGSRFIFHEDTIYSSDHRYAYEHRRTELGKLIEENTDIVGAVSIKELKALYSCDWSGDEVLRVLLKLGKISATDFQAAGEVSDDF